MNVHQTHPHGKITVFWFMSMWSHYSGAVLTFWPTTWEGLMRSVFGCYLPEVTWCLKESWRQFDLLFICCAYMDSTWTAGFSSTQTTKIEVVLCRRAKPMWNWRPWRWSCRWRPGPPGQGRVGSGVKDVDGRCRGWTNFHQFPYVDIDYIDLGLISDKW